MVNLIKIIKLQGEGVVARVPFIQSIRNFVRLLFYGMRTDPGEEGFPTK